MKRVKFPDGYVGAVSDKVAAVLAKKKGHEVLPEQPELTEAPAKKPASAGGGKKE